MVTLVATSAHAVPAGGVWISGGSVLVLLAGAVVQRSASGPQTSVQDLADQAEVDKRTASGQGVGELTPTEIFGYAISIR